jgi:hypothetical protein
MGYLRRQGVHNGQDLSSGTPLTSTGFVTMGYLRRQGVHNGQGMSSGTPLTSTGFVTMGYLRRQGSLGCPKGQL